MHRIAVTCFSLVLFVLQCSGKLFLHGRLAQHESTPSLPPRWAYHSEADDNEPLHLRVALRQPNEDFLSHVHQISDPEHPQYGRHLSASELRDIMPNLDPTASLVEAWLVAHAVPGVSRSGEWVEFETTVAHARTLLDAKFAKYSYDGREPVLRTLSYSVPSALSDKIDFIFPATQFLDGFAREPTPTLAARQHIPTGPATCNDSTCSKLVAKKYNINYTPPDNLSKSKIGIAGFLEQYPNTDDLHEFLQKYGLSKQNPPYNFSVELINGGKNPETLNTSGVEAMLDLDYSIVFTGPLKVTFYSTGGRPPTLKQPGHKPLPKNKSQNEPFLQFLEHLLAQKSPPQVISISYSDTEQTVPLAYARRVCNHFGRLASRGVSVIGASGDGGATGTGNSNCKGPDGKLRFLPTFPSSCPWVTSVGATAGYGGAASFSSGGFSNYFQRPSWQTDAVQHYIRELNGTHDGFYNATGRGIPDVSLLGDDYLIVSGGFASSHDGTSASTPVFAAMITLINDLRLRAGKPVLGFLNPLLYSEKVKSVFKDITDGQSVGCSTDSVIEPGYEALAGWDAVTGLGEPDFAALKTALT